MALQHAGGFNRAGEAGVHGGGGGAVHVQPGVVTLQHGAGGQVTKAEAKAHGGVHIFRRGNALINHGEGFAGQRVLQAVGQKPRLVLAHQHGHAAAAAHVAAQLLRLRRIGLRAQHHLDQRHQVGRHEKVQAQHAFLRLQALGNGTDGKAGAVAGQQRMCGGELDQLRKQRLLGRQFFGDAFDHQRHIAPRDILQGGHRLNLAGARGQAQWLQTRTDMGRQLVALAGMGIGHRHPAAATRQDDGDIGAHGARAYHDGVGMAGMVG